MLVVVCQSLYIVLLLAVLPADVLRGVREDASALDATALRVVEGRRGTKLQGSHTRQHGNVDKHIPKEATPHGRRRHTMSDQTWLVTEVVMTGLNFAARDVTATALQGMAQPPRRERWERMESIHMLKIKVQSDSTTG